MDFSDQAVTSNQVARRHPRHCKVTSRITRFINGNRVIDGLTLQEVERILVDVVDTDRHHTKIRSVEFFAQSVQGR